VKQFPAQQGCCCCFCSKGTSDNYNQLDVSVCFVSGTGLYVSLSVLFCVYTFLSVPQFVNKTTSEVGKKADVLTPYKFRKFKDIKNSHEEEEYWTKTVTS
jgi:hypothetical protein